MNMHLRSRAFTLDESSEVTHITNESSSPVGEVQHALKPSSVRGFRAQRSRARAVIDNYAGEAARIQQACELDGTVATAPIPSDEHLLPTSSTLSMKSIPTESLDPCQTPVGTGSEKTGRPVKRALRERRRPSCRKSSTVRNSTSTCDDFESSCLDRDNTDVFNEGCFEDENLSPSAQNQRGWTSGKRKASFLSNPTDSDQQSLIFNAKRPAVEHSSASEVLPTPPGSHHIPLLHTSQPFADSTIFQLDENGIRKQMEDLYNKIVSCVYEELSREGCKTGRSAVFALGRSVDSNLVDLYHALLPKSHFTRSRADICNTMSAPDLGIALVGAFVFTNVFVSSQVETAQILLSSVKEALGCFYPKVEAGLERFCTNLDTLLRRAYLDCIREPDFKDAKFTKAAVHLADDLADRLFSHFESAEESCSSRDSRQSAIIRMSQGLSKIIERALILKCELSSARDDYQFSWFQYGEEGDGKLMESTHGGGKTILTTVFPGLVVERNGAKKSVCRARVRFMKEEASGKLSH